MGEITLSKEEFRALASETRTGIMKLLGERNHTLSEISKKMALAAPTVKQHLTVLEAVGLIECIDEGRKWKYYSLTKKGRKILRPGPEVGILLALGLSVLGMAAALYGLLPKLAAQFSVESAGERGLAAKAIEIAAEGAAPVKGAAVPAAYGETVFLLGIAAIFSALTVIFLARLLKKK
jgi:DNA-binding transcriptional ArsR family regulator